MEHREINTAFIEFVLTLLKTDLDRKVVGYDLDYSRL